MVSEKKKQQVKEVTAELKKHSAIGIINMHCLPGRQLFQIRNKLRGKATIRMVKKRLIMLALKNSKLDGIDGIVPAIKGEPALLLSNENPFKLARVIQESKSKAAAKPGDVAPNDIEVKAGPTSLMAGPVIGELQRLKIPASVEDGKIAIKQDTVIAKAGDEISPELASMLSKLGIEPMEIGLNLVSIWEDGYIYQNELLFTPPEKYKEDLLAAHSRAFALSVSMGYMTRYNAEHLLSKAHREAVALATEANIITSETLKPLLAKADAQASAIKGMIKEAPPEEPKAEGKPAEKEDAPKEEEAPAEKPAEEQPDKEAEKQGDNATK